MYDKAVNTYHSAMQFFPDRFKIQKICNKGVDNCSFVFLINVQLCDKVVSGDPFMLKQL